MYKHECNVSPSMTMGEWGTCTYIFSAMIFYFLFCGSNPGNKIINIFHRVVSMYITNFSISIYTT